MEPTKEKEKAQEMADAFNERATLYESYSARVVERTGQCEVEITSKWEAFSLEVIEVMMEITSWYGAQMYISATEGKVYAYIY